MFQLPMSTHFGFRVHHAVDSWTSEESAAAVLWDSRPRRDKREGMRSIPQGPSRINSQSSGLSGASSLQDTKRQGAGDSPRDWVGWALGRDSNNSFLNPDTWDIQVLSWSFISLCTSHIPIHIRVNSIINAFFCIELLLTSLYACVG